MAKRSTQMQERATMDEIEAMPALLDTEDGARITGETPLIVARRCAAGYWPAIKVGKAWRINKAALLAQLGLA